MSIRLDQAIVAVGLAESRARAQALIEAGVGDSDIRMAVEIGQAVKDQASSIIQEAADVLAGTDLSSGARAIKCEPCDEE